MAPDAAADSGERLTQLAPGRHGNGLYIDPVYNRRGMAGALPAVWLRAETARRTAQAARELAPKQFGLLVLDGWRSRALQASLWESYRADLEARTGLAGERLDRRAREFVSPPGGYAVPPGGYAAPPAHTTGGAVDVTLCTLDGDPVEMGGEFDELTDRSHPDYYERDPLTDDERVYRDRRRLLQSAMSSAGFWRLPTEWWHFEYGTAGWASGVGAEPIYGETAIPGQ